VIRLVSQLAEDPAAAIEAARDRSPYIDRLVRRSGHVLDAVPDVAGADWLAGHLAPLADLAQRDEAGALADLRRAKAAGHLLIAAGDLSFQLDLAGVTGALSRLADETLSAALAWACAAQEVATDGLFIIALGKHGAQELNYSSDIDVAVFFDPEIFDGGRRSPGEAATRVTRRLLHLMEHMSEDGYVFRTDLRLRPDPGSTPPAVSTRMAEIYYESVGQNWERMVYIKARPVAGDRDAADAFLQTLRPYVWRRHLDYWAIADIHAIKRQIQQTGQHAGIGAPDADLKLGPGGIREIEFFAQTQQLILGGRDDSLRSPRTLDALDGLTEAGVVDADTAAMLKHAYVELRGVEHRIQMRCDEQTHTLPANDPSRADVAALCGWADLAAFDAAITSVREQVNAAYGELFGEEDRRTASAQRGNLVFTGVDHDPGTLNTLRDMGFSKPAAVIDTVANWHRGKVPATRTERGRELLTALVPELLATMAETGENDLAFQRFTRFFEGLSSGVQTLSMLIAEPELLADLVETLALAPGLSQTLSRRPELLESLLVETEPVAEAFARVPDLDFETALDEARRVHRDTDFLIGFNVLQGTVDASDAGAAYADLADATISAMARVAARETCRRSGDEPGCYVVCGLGKLGGREMSSGSDLDLIVIYDPGEGASGAAGWFTRFTQTLVTALSAPTAEGLLYEVDMQLRPSGNAGPVAVRLSAFETYQREEAWTWEHMAISRLRPITGDAGLMAEVSALTDAVISRPRDPDALRADVHDMRLRLERARRGQGLWDLKLDPGGLVDAEFIVQHALLAAGERAGEVRRPGTLAAIEALGDAGLLSSDERAPLRAGVSLLLHLQQVLRVATTRLFDPETAANGLKHLIAKAADCDTLEAAAERLAGAKQAIAALRCKRIGPLATETADSSV
jgi:[glutamine synthetase] adenylyltransferase / [glutamine synthetase]-adenylyl-L-tyrosine phosphorylase